MNDYQTIKRILNLSEVNVIGKQAYLDRYKINNVEIDFKLVLLLITFGILELDSGNFETGEENYFLNDKFIFIDRTDENKKIILLTKIIERFDEQKFYFTQSFDFDRHIEIVKIFYKIKSNYIRKEKLIKLKNPE